MNKIFFILVIFLFSSFFIFILISIVNGNSGNPIAELNKGENYFNFNSSYSFFASDIILLNPEIEVISYHDVFTGTDLFYVNVFGGVGKDFEIVKDREYKIYVKQNIILEVP